jgi:uncharacterized phiE125 gp8 family phage protein
MTFRNKPTSRIISPQRVDVTTAATSDPLSLDDAKDFARIAGDDDDNTVRRLIGSATNYLEAITGRRFVNTTLTAYFDAFPAADEDYLELRHLPVSSVSSIKYIDADDGTTNTWTAAEYDVDNVSENIPCRITTDYSYSWPSVRDEQNAVRVEFVSGYGSSHTSVPDDVKHAIALLVSHWFTHRDLQSTGSMPFVLKSMIDKLRWDAP